MPQPSTVWFLREDDTIRIDSQPDVSKPRNIARNGRVALHLDGDGRGGDIVVLTGEARHDEGMPPATAVPAYRAAIRVTPERLRGH